MPILSRKGINMPESPIRKLVPYAEKAKKNNIEVLHLNIGQPDIPPPDNVIRKINNFNINSIEYSHSAGMEEYRTNLSKYYKKINPQINKQNILISTGGSEALSITLNCICDPNDEIIIPDPYYANYNGFSHASNVKIVPIICQIENDFKLPEIDEFENRISKKTKAIVICNPGNPTGALYSKAELEQLAHIVKKYDIFLIADEVYREFIYDQNKHFSILNLKSIQENTIIIDSVSKRYSMCGARIGSIISLNMDFINTALKFAQARLSPPTFGQIAAMEALKTQPLYFKEIIEEYDKRRKLLVNGLNKIKGVKCPMPKGAFYCIAELPVQDTEHFCRWLLEKFHLNNTTVMLAPAHGFYSQKNGIKNQVRIAYVLELKKLQISIEIIQSALATYNEDQS
ncbi:MAG: aspartate aminotransferase [Flavobacteriales bacterium]|nr:aspartate aminotransferase [Flavobacteriales bacterium]|tara:strand:- start:4615 stop:5814 length:1200 start_codon:yes stop_codon:yes gene_type:complete